MITDGPSSKPLLVDEAGDDSDGEATCLRRRALKVLLVLLLANASALAILLTLGNTYPSLISAGVLAMSFGLRHAVDADHIAAIDNVTRRLIADGRQPLLVGLWFSLGHSSVVCIICVAAAIGSEYVHDVAHELGGAGAVVTVTVSAGLLLAVGVANLISAVLICRSSGSKDGQPDHEHGGLVTRCCPFLLNSIDAEWKMLLLGFLFGLGFETSSEVALLALAGMSPAQGIPPAATLILPLLFAGGMSLIDTVDGMVMSWAYGRAQAQGSGRQFYNLTLTVASSLIAIGVGVVELLGFAQDRLDLHGPFWSLVEAINDNFEYVGYFVICFFAVSMVMAFAAFACPRPRRLLDACVTNTCGPAQAEVVFVSVPN